ncbi:lipopolysaccharide heptosyltransferase family protein [Rhodoplanes serenus]|uniref:Lipopolysaccharide heptosyltransferase family protein n=1 Tax=Rhodoplanes serenus TaxID=200615 RepID=A0A9X4XH33_9BRAD|nr:glycosyltransferase family 9 protein [Rhodoplanes serenus]MTW15057.1 lipopolysaccharide heptosyltransferase family protein [Rhodoplanes serenus]
MSPPPAPPAAAAADSPAASSAPPRPIAVLVDREGLGDSLLKLPFLRAIARAYPDHPIWWISSHQTAMANDLAPFVRPLIARVIDHAGLTTPPRAVIARLRALPPFEMVFDSRTRGLTVLLARLFLRHRGFYCCLPGYMLSSRRPPGRFARPSGIAARMLSLAAAAIGGEPDWRGRLDIAEAARRLAAERLPEGPVYVGLAPGSREARKNWPIDRYVALARRLAESGRVPVFMIGPQEAEMVATIRRAVPEALLPEVEPVDPGLGLKRLELAIAVGERLAAVVANDNGIGHLMASIGTPLVSLFGPTDIGRWAPFTEQGVIVSATQFGGTAMEAIPVDAAFAAAERLLVESRDGAHGGSPNRR